jgi:hypothetical protein
MMMLDLRINEKSIPETWGIELKLDDGWVRKS